MREGGISFNAARTASRNRRLMRLRATALPHLVVTVKPTRQRVTVADAVSGVGA
jgi:hypothetical protein